MRLKKCGAKNRDGSKCQNPAGHGTDHVGSGKCRLHGGASNGAPKGNKNAVKHGIYSRLFSEDELEEAKAMQGNVESELAIARLQLFKVMQEQKRAGNKIDLFKVEETTIVEDEKDKKKKEDFLRMLVRSAKEAGEEYDPDGDEDDLFDPDEDNPKESEPFQRKRTFQQRDYNGEIIRLISLIARLEQQAVSTRKLRAEIKVVEAMADKDKDKDADNQLTDTQLDSALQSLITGFPL